MLVSFEQPENALPGISLIFAFSSTVSSSLQLSKIPYPIDVTDSGIVICVSLLPKNADTPIDFSVLGRTISVMYA